METNSVKKPEDILLEIAIENGKDTKTLLLGYPDSDSGLERFKLKSLEFFMFVKNYNCSHDEKMAPTIEAYCVFLGINTQAITRYARRGKEWNDTIVFFEELLFFVSHGFVTEIERTNYTDVPYGENNVEIRSLIRKKRLRYADVARAIGIDPTTFSKWLRFEIDKEKKLIIINAINGITW